MFLEYFLNSYSSNKYSNFSLWIKMRLIFKRCLLLSVRRRFVILSRVLVILMCFFVRWYKLLVSRVRCLILFWIMLRV